MGHQLLAFLVTIHITVCKNITLKKNVAKSRDPSDTEK
jgi:hypothetical protein